MSTKKAALAHASYPTAPLIPFIRRAMKHHADVYKREDGYLYNDGPVNLSRRICWQMGLKPITVERYLSRILTGEEEWMTERSADRWAVGLGMHPCEIWGDVYWCSPQERTARKMEATGR